MKYTGSQMETAMCVWEEIMTRRSNDNDDPLNGYWDHFGTAQVRDDCIAISVWIDAIWNGMDEQVWDTCFDWEFVPRMLDQVKWDKTSEHMYKGDAFFPLPSVAEGRSRYLLTYGWSK